MTDLRARFLSVSGAALILMFFSELFFMNEGPTQTITNLLSRPGIALMAMIELALYYAFFAWGFLLVWHRAQKFGLAGIILAGSLFGWVTEGTIVAVVHEAPPDSWIWPSVSWHALIDVFLGLFILRLVMRRCGIVTRALIFVAVGAVWALWATWLWGDPTHTRMTPGLFSFFSCVSTAIWVAGMILLDQARSWSPTRWETLGVATATAALAILMASAALPWSIVILMVALCVLWAVTGRTGDRGPTHWRIDLPAPRPVSYLLALLVPATASLNYGWLWSVGWHIPTEEVTSAALLVGACALFWALWRVFTIR